MWGYPLDQCRLCCCEGLGRVIDVGTDEKVTNKILSSLPFCVPFEVRAALYYKARDELRAAAQEGRPSTRVTIHRSRLFEVGAQGCSAPSPRLFDCTDWAKGGVPAGCVDVIGSVVRTWSERSVTRNGD